MKFIIIKKNGKLVEKEMFDGKKTKKPVSKLSEYLGAEVEFEEGLTFKTFFNLIVKESEFFNTLFKQELMGMKLKEYQTQMRKKQTDTLNVNNEGDEMQTLEITKMFELLHFEKGNTIDLYAVFVGIGKSKEDEEIYMPTSLIPINNIKNYVISLNKSVEIFKESEEQDEVGIRPLLLAASSITLYEALQSIIYEVSYFGTAEDKIKQKKKQEKECNLEERVIELEKYLDSLVESEEYEKASKVKKELDRIKGSKK